MPWPAPRRGALLRSPRRPRVLRSGGWASALEEVHRLAAGRVEALALVGREGRVAPPRVPPDQRGGPLRPRRLAPDLEEVRDPAQHRARVRNQVLETDVEEPLSRELARGGEAAADLVAPVAAVELDGRPRLEQAVDRRAVRPLELDQSLVGVLDLPDEAVHDRDRDAQHRVLAHRERGLAPVTVQVHEARIREELVELGQELDRGARALDPRAPPEAAREPVEDLAVVRGQGLSWGRF